MKAALPILLIAHGLIHLFGFAKAWNLLSIRQVTTPDSIPSPVALLSLGIVWLLVFLAFTVTGIAVFAGKSWFWLPAMIAVTISQLLIIIYWQDAKWGTIANALILLIAIAGFANWKFNKQVEREVGILFHKSDTLERTEITSEMTLHLPPPVQRWLKSSGILGKEQIHFIRLKQKGFMRIKPEQEKWIEVNAEQYFTIDNPAFIWKAEMNYMPFLPVTGRDKWVNGKGEMKIQAFSLVNVVNQADEKIDQAALQRWLAEICWFPSAALSPFITWEKIDENSAKATINYKGVRGAMDFQFENNGDLKSCFADRYMGGGKDAKLEKWEVNCTEYGLMNGIRLPIKSEATWKLKSGEFTWYKLQITQIDYNNPKVYP